MKEMNPSLEETFLRMRTALEADHAYLEQQTEALMCEAASDDGIDLEILAAADPALRHRAEEKLLEQKQLPVSRKNILLLDTVVQGVSFGTEIGEYRFVRRGGSLVFDALSCYRADPVILPDDGGKAEVKIEKIDSKGNKAEYRKIDIYFTVTDYIDYDRLRKVYKNLLYFAVDYDTIKNDAVIRTRMPGDKVFLPGRNGHKTLKKLFQEHHLSKEKRESSLMLAEGREVIWLEGFGVGADYLPTDKTKRVLIAWKERMASL